MAAYHAEYPCDLAKPSQAIAIPYVFTTGDHESHRFTALVYDSGNPACGLMAGNVSGAVVLPDGSTVPLTNGEKGELRTIHLSDGKSVQATPCTVTTVQACFAYTGRVKLLIRLIDGETATTVLSALAQVQQGLTGTIIDPGDVIEDITTLIADANAAAQTAEQAASDAQAALAQASDIVSYAEQTGKTDAEKAQARTNIGAASDGDVADLKSAIEVLEPAATEADVGKSLIAKTVSGGKVTEYEFGDAGASVVVDPTLSHAGEAADAKATGDIVSVVTKTMKEWLKNGDLDQSKYYGDATGSTSYSSTWAVFDVVIPVSSGVTYYYKNINPRFSWYRYDNETSGYFANTNAITSGTFTAADDGTVIITSGNDYGETALFTDSIEIYNAGNQADLTIPKTDKTLTNEYMPANAKAVGDRFGAVDDFIEGQTTVIKEWLKSSDFINGKYYSDATGTKSNGWACFDIEIPIVKGVKYFYKNINPRFSWYRYDNGDSNYFKNSNSVQNGTIYAMDNGSVIISTGSDNASNAIFTESEAIYTAGIQQDLTVSTVVTKNDIQIESPNYYRQYMVKPKYYDTSGNLQNGANHAEVPVTAGETIKVFYKGATSVQLSQIQAYVFYADSEIDTVIHYNLLDKTYIDGQLVITVTVPDGCDTVGFNVYMASFDIKETCVVCNEMYDPANISDSVCKLLNNEIQDKFAREKLGKLSGIKSVLNGKFVTCLGDSITEVNSWADKNWVALLAEWTGCNVQNLGASGTGLTSENSKIANINPAVDIIGVAISFNDMTLLPTLGDVTDTGTSTYCGMANTFLDNLVTAFPTVPIICYSQGPWGSYHKGVESSDARIEAIKTICAKHGVPFYGDLYEVGCVLKPWIQDNIPAYYTSSSGQTNNIHPNSAGHTIIARYLVKCFEQNVVDTHSTIYQ